MTLDKSSIWSWLSRKPRHRSSGAALLPGSRLNVHFFTNGGVTPDSNRYPFYLIKRNLVLPAVIELGCPRRFMVSDLLRHFQLAAVLQIRRNASRAESMITNPRFDAGRFRPPADDAVGVLLEEGIGGKLTGLAARTAKEIAVDVVGDAGRFDILVQTLIETVMTGDVVLFTAFFV